ncbi:MAG: FAD-binding oxidoreductase, partial [Pseudomonadota bacterium]
NKAPLTHDTYRYIFDRPANLDFEPGQAAELTLHKEGWTDEGRAFTFTSLPSDDDLEFVIKSYPSHSGVTELLPDLPLGGAVELDGPFGAIKDQGPGVFLAAGAGITPFIAILRARAQAGTLDGCHLVFSNKTAGDIILRDDWAAMDGLRVTHVLADEEVEGAHKGEVDAAFLKAQEVDLSGHVYICGPQGYVDAMRDAVTELGVAKDKIITEDGW